MIILQDISDDDNIVQIIENYFANSELEDDELLEEHRTLHIRNQNYYDTTVSQYSLDDFYGDRLHFQM